MVYSWPLETKETRVQKRYVVKLTDAERAGLLALTGRGKASARRIKRALVLLRAEEGIPDTQIATGAGVGTATVERIRKRFVEEGLEEALSEKPRRPLPAKLDGKGEALLLGLACSDAPEGRARWSMQMLADRLVEMGAVDAISDETVRRTLKKARRSRGSASSG
jgi:transposase